MIDKRLITYIEDNLKVGYPPQNIREYLVSQGYVDQDVYDTIMHVEQQMAAPQKPPKNLNMMVVGPLVLLALVIVAIPLALMFMIETEPELVVEPEVQNAQAFSQTFPTGYDGLEVSGVQSNSVLITSDDFGTSISIAVGESRSLDIDQDGTEDVSIELVDIVDGVPQVVVTEISADDFFYDEDDYYDDAYLDNTFYEEPQSIEEEPRIVAPVIQEESFIPQGYSNRQQADRLLNVWDNRSVLFLKSEDARSLDMIGLCVDFYNDSNVDTYRIEIDGTKNYTGDDLFMLDEYVTEDSDRYDDGTYGLVLLSTGVNERWYFDQIINENRTTFDAMDESEIFVYEIDYCDDTDNFTRYVVQEEEVIAEDTQPNQKFNFTTDAVPMVVDESFEYCGDATEIFASFTDKTFDHENNSVNICFGEAIIDGCSSAYVKVFDEDGESGTHSISNESGQCMYQTVIDDPKMLGAPYNSLDDVFTKCIFGLNGTIDVSNKSHTKSPGKLGVAAHQISMFQLLFDFEMCEGNLQQVSWSLAAYERDNLEIFPESEVQYYQAEDYFKNETLNCVTEHDDDIFVTSDKKIWRFTGNSFFEIETSAPLDEYFEDYNLECYLRTTRGEEVFIVSEGLFKRLLISDGDQEKYRSLNAWSDYLLEDENGNIWVLAFESYKGLAKFDTNRNSIDFLDSIFENYSYVDYLGYNRETDELVVRARINLSTDPGIWIYKDDKWRQDVLFPIQKPFVVLDQYYVQLGGADTINFLNKTDITQAEDLRIKEGSSFLKYIYMDKQGRIWIKGSNSHDHQPGVVLLEFND